MMLTKLLILFLSLLLVACQSEDGNNNETTKLGANKAKTKHMAFSYDSNDWQLGHPDAGTKIDFSKTDVTIDGGGVEKEKGLVTISKSGAYSLSGSYSGKIVVDAPPDDVVYLTLNNLKIKSPTAGAIEIKQAKKVVITLAEGSHNTITDHQSTDKDIKGAISSKADLSFNGEGKLKIIANHRHAIDVAKHLVIMSGHYDVTAKEDGFKAKDGLVIHKANINLVAEGDGLVVTNEEDKKKGFILIEDGKFNLKTGRDAIQSVSLTEILGGTFNITTSADMTEDISAKGLKSDGILAISNGAYTIDAVDDTINALNVVIEGGSMTLKSGDDALHADQKMTITAGMVRVIESLEGIEGEEILITGGNLNITSSDDAINAANDRTEVEPRLTITGGDVLLTAGGDGVDVNGDFIMSDGRLTVFASPNAENMVIDYDNLFRLEGGTLIAVGTVGMIGDLPYANMVSEYVQPTLTISLPSQYAGTAMQIIDSDGNEVINITPTVNYAYALVSSPDIQSGETYSVYIGGQSVATGQAMVSQLTQP